MEAEFIRWLTDRLGVSPRVPLGIGDDAAVLAASSYPTVVTTDMLMDGTDFQLQQVAPRRIGRKALAVNLSDLAAMGARPTAALVSVALPKQGGGALARELAEGILELAQAFETPLVGGDTNSWEGPLVISITAIGELDQGPAWRRSGARPGDQILVTGPLGGSLLGHHFDFQPRVREALWLRSHYAIQAATDISDGLSLDLSHILQASQCGAVLDLSQVPLAAAAHEASASDGRSPLEHALSDGEDFELILVVAPEDATRLLADAACPLRLTRIGEIRNEPGLFSREADGLRPLPARGYQHEFDE